VPIWDDAVPEVKKILSSKISQAKSVDTLTEQILGSAEVGLEYNDSWVRRFRYHLVWLDNDDYTAALAKALYLAPKLAPTDYGGSRQRDLAQVWTDTVRGFLGERAMAKFLLRQFGIDAKFILRRGETEEFLSNDLERVKRRGKKWRKPRIDTSIKTSKFNGRSFPTPGGSRP
jgi:hypothetical protein